ncbi:MAG: acyl carrier protein [Propionibacterium sp.]|nr:MAG: acyl carrier protein [Propionibacterium sp.]
MATSEEIYTDIAEIITDITGTEASQLEPSSLFVGDLEIDSLSMVEIIYSCEEKFDISIPDEAANGFKKIADLVSYIENELD